MQIVFESEEGLVVFAPNLFSVKICLCKITEKAIFFLPTRLNLLISCSFCLRRRMFPPFLEFSHAHPCGIRATSFGRVPRVVTRLRLFHRAAFYCEFAKCITRPSSNALCRQSHRDRRFPIRPALSRPPYFITILLRASEGSRAHFVNQQV